MSRFHYYHPIEVRYGDLDPQGHLNNARYLTFLEQARMNYLIHLGLWDGHSFFDIGIIMADAHITFREPVLLGQKVRVGVHISRLGNKSLDMDYVIQDSSDERDLAVGSTVLVAYDYNSGETIPIPDRWRDVISEFEHLPQS